MRAFVAVDLPFAVQEALETVQERLPVGRPTDPEQFHLTLAFLDDQPGDVLEELHHELERVKLPRFALQMRGLGTFGKHEPRVLWAGVEPEPALKELRGKVRSAARVAGIELSRERFRPHVTLARFDERMEPDELEKLRRFLEIWETFPSPPFEVTEFVLYRSILGKGGAVHEALAEYPL
ncbi:RNA 2',3'-cyclic phosphodiesterase [Psychromarinibacter sp. C21-152]|uniref:RNA 2',3'-cyclic phosphodiesterase n=1 Tax=Psychromarinibacter sediminicola TaxID=3033385 RepID=A0AAE3NU59_9RHOB|nr:RNA 2',3'-cyclic phosphodiesterase [Psychromarinibacter sediminicola]MDF0600647.1 RNA 2',3'-cyclic phosphodiesterase [Psychromarinibacter sediminicola]